MFQNTAIVSGNRAGHNKTIIIHKRKKIEIQELTENSFKGVDIALFSAGGAISKKFSPLAVKAGAIVVDNPSGRSPQPGETVTVAGTLETIDPLMRNLYVGQASLS